MKIVQVANTLSVLDGGPARNASELNLALNALQGTQSTLFSVTGRDEESLLTTDEVYSTGGPRKIVRLKLWGRKDSGASSIFTGLRELLGADVVIIHGYFLFWIPPLTVLLTLCRIPYVITPHGSLTVHQQQFSRRKKRLYEAFAGCFVRKHLSSFVTGSAIEAQELSVTFPQSEVSVGGVGVILPVRFKAAHPLLSPVRLLSMSRIAEVKRIDISIRAVEILCQRGYDVKLTVAGVGPDDVTKRLQTLGHGLVGDNRLEFVGQVTGAQKSRLFCESDIFLMPSDNENFGIGFAEAMAHGLPSVVSSKVASATNLPSDAGVVLVDPTPQSMADAIASVLTSGAHNQAQEIARRFAETEFSWSAVAENWRIVLARYKKHSVT